MTSKQFDKLVDIIENSRKGPALTKWDVAKAIKSFVEKEIEGRVAQQLEIYNGFPHNKRLMR